VIEISYQTGGSELLDTVGPLWEQLNEHHRQRAIHFSGEYARRTYAQRKAGLLEKAQKAALRADLAQDTGTGRFVAYCISTISSDGIGEIESIFVEADYRHLGIGQTLMSSALEWMKHHGTRSVQALVAEGNEEAFGFYERYDFHPRYTLLKRP